LTCEKLNGFFGYETPLLGEQYTETVKDSLGEHTVLRYKPVALSGAAGEVEAAWKPGELQPGKKLS